MKQWLLLCLLTLSIQARGVTLRVPSSIKFVNIRLRISEDAKERIQEKVNNLTRNDKYFRDLLDRANLFLPIVERVLKEERLPLDFKYLVIQESTLVSDAVSTANAVGFWQFKEPAAREMGLKIDQNVDERMHIAAATRAAAKYLKQHNQEFNNWLYALLAYNEGRTGAQKFIKKRYLGARKMEIAKQEHVYIIHFLAHKVAFEQVLGKSQHPELYLHEYLDTHGKTLSEIAKEFGVSKSQVTAYNKWLKRYRVPRDTTCAAIVPMTHQQYACRVASRKKGTPKRDNIDYAKYRESAEKFPVITQHKKEGIGVASINGIPGTVALEGDNSVSLAQVGNISLEKFLAFNDLDQHHVIMPGQVYYYRPKKNKADIHFHVARQEETWWTVAQKYGIKKRVLLLKNRLRKEEELNPGNVLWLRFIRPANIPFAYVYSPNMLD